MAKRKKTVTVRRARVPNGFSRIELTFPKTTEERIIDHCKRNSLNQSEFLRKAIYDALPVHYEVTEEFVFPFGKYAGETAGVVKRIDPSYIDWCVRSITGFTLADDMIEAREEVSHEEMSGIAPALRGASTPAPRYPRFVSMEQCNHEVDARNGDMKITHYKLWCKTPNKFHLVATRKSYCAPWEPHLPQRWISNIHA